jgi:hypothetical protein
MPCGEARSVKGDMHGDMIHLVIAEIRKICFNGEIVRGSLRRLPADY